MSQKLTTIFALAGVTALAVAPGALAKKDTFKATVKSSSFAATYDIALKGKKICVKGHITQNDLGGGAFQPEDLSISAKGDEFFGDAVSTKERCKNGGAVGKAIKKKGKATVTVLDGYGSEIAKGKLK